MNAERVSFVSVFQRAVARAVFCRNPWAADDGTRFEDSDGRPKCARRDLLEGSEFRVQVQRVAKGSIIVDFVVRPNRTADEPTAAEVLLELSRQLGNRRSPVCRDVEFGHFAVVAEVVEVDVPQDYHVKAQQAAVFEGTRSAYDEGNACELHRRKGTGRGCASTA